jgi:hypothetical protein
MSAITIPQDILIKYDNDNILFEFPAPIMTVPGNFYYMIYDLAGLLKPIKLNDNLRTYNLIDGIVAGKTYVFRVRAFTTTGQRSQLTSARVVTMPGVEIHCPPVTSPPVQEAPAPAPAELASTFQTAFIDNDPIPEDTPQIITNYPGVTEALYVYAETIVLEFAEPKHLPAVEFSKFIDFKNNLTLAYGYQGRNKYDFDTLLKIRMGKMTTTLK